MDDSKMQVMVCDWRDVGLEDVKGKWEERWKEGRRERAVVSGESGGGGRGTRHCNGGTNGQSLVLA
jgi:hypothetical protein